MLRQSSLLQNYHNWATQIHLYQEFINPDTATYGIKYVDEEITPESLTDREILQDELGRLCTLQNKFVDDEEYEKAEIMKRKITQLQNKIDKLWLNQCSHTK